MSDLIPKPDVIRQRLDKLADERRDLRRLLKLAERCHGEVAQPPRPDGTKLETK